MSEHLIDLALVLDGFFLHPWVDFENIKRLNAVIKK